jgi:hypothetical protein
MTWQAIFKSPQFIKHLRVEAATIVAIVASIVVVRNVYHSKASTLPFV